MRESTRTESDRDQYCDMSGTCFRSSISNHELDLTPLVQQHLTLSQQAGVSLSLTLTVQYQC